MRRIDMNKIKKWLDVNADIIQRDYGSTDEPNMVSCYVTKGRGDYIGMVGMEEDGTALQYMVHFDIWDDLHSRHEPGCAVSVGFSKESNKWYGWSHRGIYGFTVGSEVKRGDCAYTPVDEEDFLLDMVRWWGDDGHVWIRGEHAVEDGIEGVRVVWKNDDTAPNERCHGELGSSFHPYPDHYGRGEWVADTLEDAKQMAYDYAEGVS